MRGAIWQCFERGMGFVCRWLAALGLIALITVSALTVVDAVLRRFFGSNIHGLSDLVEWCIIIAVSACFPAMVWGHHTITVRVLGSVMPWRVRESLELFGHTLLLAALVVISWQLSLYSYDIYYFGDVSMLMLWPKWPVWAAASVIWWFTGLVQLNVVGSQILRVTARQEPATHEIQESI